MNHSTIARTLARGIRLFVVAALLGATVTIAAPPPVAQASTIDVDTDVDDSLLKACTPAPGDCSLRGAIDNAKANSGLDTITFAAATDGTDFLLTGAANEDGNASGDLDILGVGGDLTIQGNGAANTIVDGGGIDRVFHVCPAGGCANTVVFNSVTIRNGKTPIAVSGGGIFNVGGTTTVDGSTVISNTALYGGGIFNNDTLTVQNGSAIGGAGTGNEATQHGGGINNYAGTTTVDGSTVSANTATDRGGGIWNQGTLNVQNGSTIGGAGTGNTANYGGGIYNYDAGTTVDDSTVSANTAVGGGGGISNWATLVVQNGSTIGGVGAANQANGTGGGIYNHSGSTTVTGSCILNNWATINGGGLYIYENSIGATKVTGSSIVGNSITSFFNNQGTEHTATGNWWGAASGPGNPGADTVGGNVDTTGHLTEPIPTCLLHVYLPVLKQTP